MKSGAGGDGPPRDTHVKPSVSPADRRREAPVFGPDEIGDPAGLLAAPESEPTSAVSSEVAKRVPRAQSGGLRRETARGTLINSAFTIGLNSLGLIKGFLVAALLTTSDYGVWGVLVIALGTLLWLKDVGIGDKYVQQSEEDQELAFQKAFTLELIFTGIFTGLLLAAVPVITVIYGQPELLAPGFVFALMLPAGALSVSVWVFYRKMDFVRQRGLEAVNPLTAFVVTVALAIAGAGYWSLVVGTFVGVWLGAIIALIASPYRLAIRYDRGTMREYVRFSWPLVIMGGSSLVIAQASIFFGERELGLAGAGAIALAATIAQYTDRVDQILTRTLYPAICAVRDRVDLLFESFVKSNRLTLMWGMPFGVGLALFAPDLVEYGIGEQWRPAVVLLQVFGVTAAANHVGFNWHAFYRAKGDTRPMAVVSFVTMLAFLAAPLPLLISRGLDGFALGMVIQTAVTLAARTFYLVRLFPGFGMAKHALRAIAPTVPALAVILAARAVEASDRSLAIAIAELLAYLAVTVAGTFFFERRLLREVIAYIRRTPGANARVAV